MFILFLCHSAVVASSWKCAPWADAKSFRVRSTLISTALAPSSGLEGSRIEMDRVKFCRCETPQTGLPSLSEGGAGHGLF